MIVAIIQQLGGIVNVSEFREAVDEATAVNDYCNGFNPPLAPGAYYGYNTGWAQYQYPGVAYRWAYNFNAPGLVQVAIPPNFVLKATVKVVDLNTPVVNNVFTELGGVVAAPSLLTTDLTKLVLRVTGLYRGTGAGNVVRVCENGNAISMSFPLADNGGVNYSTFFFNTNVNVSAGLNIYTLQGALGSLLNALELKYVTFNLLLIDG